MDTKENEIVIDNLDDFKNYLKAMEPNINLTVQVEVKEDAVSTEK